MMGDQEPPFLTLGTEVSAKFKGAFCEAKIKKVAKSVTCKVQFFNCSHNSIQTISDDDLVGFNGALQVGYLVKSRHPLLPNQICEAKILKIIDGSTYTVEFDDGDIRVLKRNLICLKGQKHFQESQTLDKLPLTNPELFGTPVVNTKKSSNASLTSEETSYLNASTLNATKQIAKNSQAEKDEKKLIQNSGNKEKIAKQTKTVGTNGGKEESKRYTGSGISKKIGVSKNGTETFATINTTRNMSKDRSGTNTSPGDAETEPLESNLVNRSSRRHKKSALDLHQASKEHTFAPAKSGNTFTGGGKYVAPTLAHINNVPETENYDEDDDEDKDKVVSNDLLVNASKGKQLQNPDKLESHEKIVIPTEPPLSKVKSYVGRKKMAKGKLLNTEDTSVQENAFATIKTSESVANKEITGKQNEMEPNEQIDDEQDDDEDDEEEEEEESLEERDHFVARLFKFMEDRGTPLNKLPSIGNTDLNYHKLHNVVCELGYYNKVTNNDKWNEVCLRIGIFKKCDWPKSLIVKRIQTFYKKYLLAFEDFSRKLGCCLMSLPTPSTPSSFASPSSSNASGNMGSSTSVHHLSTSAVTSDQLLHSTLHSGTHGNIGGQPLTDANSQSHQHHAIQGRSLIREKRFSNSSHTNLHSLTSSPIKPVHTTSYKKGFPETTASLKDENSYRRGKKPSERSGLKPKHPGLQEKGVKGIDDASKVARKDTEDTKMLSNSPAASIESSVLSDNENNKNDININKSNDRLPQNMSPHSNLESLLKKAVPPKNIDVENEITPAAKKRGRQAMTQNLASPGPPKTETQLDKTSNSYFLNSAELSTLPVISYAKSVSHLTESQDNRDCFGNHQVSLSSEISPVFGGIGFTKTNHVITQIEGFASLNSSVSHVDQKSDRLKLLTEATAHYKARTDSGDINWINIDESKTLMEISEIDQHETPNETYDHDQSKVGKIQGGQITGNPPSSHKKKPSAYILPEIELDFQCPLDFVTIDPNLPLAKRINTTKTNINVLRKVYQKHKTKVLEIEKILKTLQRMEENGSSTSEIKDYYNNVKDNISSTNLSSDSSSAE